MQTGAIKPNKVFINIDRSNAAALLLLLLVIDGSIFAVFTFCLCIYNSVQIGLLRDRRPGKSCSFCSPLVFYEVCLVVKVTGKQWPETGQSEPKFRPLNQNGK